MTRESGHVSKETAGEHQRQSAECRRPGSDPAQPTVDSRSGKQDAGQQFREAVQRNEAIDVRARFEALALPQFAGLYRAAMRMTRSREEAEDLVQETFLKAFRSFRTLRLDHNPRAWLFRILTNSHINRCRRRRAQPFRARLQDIQEFLPAAEAPAVIVPYELDIMLDEQLDSRVKHALEGLPDGSRPVVMMALVGGMSYGEIAQALECPTGTVMSRLYRARRVLRQRLAEYARQQGYGRP